MDQWLEGKDYLIGDLSGAEIMLGPACFMANRRGAVTEEMPHLAAYVERLTMQCCEG